MLHLGISPRISISVEIGRCRKFPDSQLGLQVEVELQEDTQRMSLGYPILWATLVAITIMGALVVCPRGPDKA